MVFERVRSKQDLSNLSKTCFDLREATLPFLFRNITLSDDPGHEIVRLSFFRAIKGTDDRGLYLLRTISELENHQRLADMLRTLKLRATTHDSVYSLVPKLIQAAPKLTRVEIHYQLNKKKGIGRRNVGWILGDRLSSALTCVKNTLEYLKVSYELVSEGSDNTRAIASSFYSLKQLHRLQTADVPFFLLLGWVPEKAPALADVLPCSLSTLQFGDDEWWMSGILWDESLMMAKFADYFQDKRWKETTPNLKKVTLSLWVYDEAEDDDYLYKEWRADGGESDFKRLCIDNGLHCDVIRKN